MAIYDCPTINIYDAGGLKYSTASQYFYEGRTVTVGNFTCGTSYGSSLTFPTEHNGSGDNPVVGDKIRVSNIVGGNFDGSIYSFPGSFGQGYLTMTLTKEDPNDSSRVVGGYVITVNTYNAEILEIYECP